MRFRPFRIWVAVSGVVWRIPATPDRIAGGKALDVGAVAREDGAVPDRPDGSVEVDPERLRHLRRLRQVRDRIDREYAQPLDVEALARGVHMWPGT